MLSKMPVERKQEIAELVKRVKEEMLCLTSMGWFRGFGGTVWQTIKNKNLIKGRRVIDIGCGYDPYYFTSFMDEGAESYTGVDIHGPRDTYSTISEYRKISKEKGDERSVEIVKKDGLEYLAEQPDESAIVCSFGVFGEEWGVRLSSKDIERYVELFCEEVYRVTPKGDITIHYQFDFPSELMEKQGFKPHICSKEKKPYTWIKA